MEYRLLAEDDLVARLKVGEDAAFKEIYTRFWKRLYKTALAKTNDHTVAEEAVQNVFVKLWQNRYASSILRLENYLHTAVKYQIINYYKSVLAKENFLKNASDRFSHSNAEEAANNLQLHEASILIDKALQQLPEKTKIIFNLSRNENLTAKQIAETMHLSEKAVEYHISKTLKQLRFYLKEIISIMIFLTAGFLH